MRAQSLISFFGCECITGRPLVPSLPSFPVADDLWPYHGVLFLSSCFLFPGFTEIIQASRASALGAASFPIRW